MKGCSQKGPLPNRHQNHCISHHCHGGEKNDDHMTYDKNTVRLFSTCSSAHGTRNGEWRGPSRDVEHDGAARFTYACIINKASWLENFIDGRKIVSF